MAKMLKMMKQVNEARRMQKQLAKRVVSIKSNDGSITVEARGDMSIKSITIAPETLANTRPEKLERVLVSTINSALDASKKAAAGDMSKLTEGMGLGDLFGG
jgi:DNA-binding YbaB/EbfC family protein